MIKKMAKFLLPWFAASQLSLGVSYFSSIALGQMGAVQLASHAACSQLINMPANLIFILCILGLVLSAIMQEKGSIKVLIEHQIIKFSLIICHNLFFHSFRQDRF